MRSIGLTSSDSSSDSGALIAPLNVRGNQTSGIYEPVRFNALKYGILSKLVVLAHEAHAELADSLAALIEEHRPAGMTERHLINQLATIIWRKRRVLEVDERGGPDNGK